jgi:hypothetical protein
LQIGFRLCDDARDFFHALAQTRDALFGRREVARDQKIKAVGQALHVNQRIPFRLFQFFGPEDFIIDVLFENSKINVVRASELRSIDGIQLVAKFLLRGEVFGSRLPSSRSIRHRNDGHRVQSPAQDWPVNIVDVIVRNFGASSCGVANVFEIDNDKAAAAAM